MALKMLVLRESKESEARMVKFRNEVSLNRGSSLLSSEPQQNLITRNPRISFSIIFSLISLAFLKYSMYVLFFFSGMSFLRRSDTMLT